MEYVGLVVRGKVVGVHHVLEKRGKPIYQGIPLRPHHQRVPQQTTDELLSALEQLGIEPVATHRRVKDAGTRTFFDLIVLTEDDLRKFTVASAPAPFI